MLISPHFECEHSLIDNAFANRGTFISILMKRCHKLWLKSIYDETNEFLMNDVKRNQLSL